MLDSSDVTTGVIKCIYREFVLAEWAISFSHMFEIASGSLLADGMGRQPNRRSCALEGRFMAAKAQVVAQHGIDVAGMAGVDGYLEGLELFGKRGAQHAVSLFGLPVGLVVVIVSALELQVVEVKSASPVAGDIDDPGRR